MQRHKFSIGQTVHLSAGPHLRASGASYQVVRLLPQEAGEYQYRIKSTREAHERVATESQLSRFG